MVDGYLFVVRANRSERGEIIHALDQLEYVQAKILGFSLNGVPLESTSYGYSKKRYRRYGYGGYGYGYGEMPQESEKRQTQEATDKSAK